MVKTISIPDDLYERLAALARPFTDKEPADVIRRLVEDLAPVPETAANRTSSGRADPLERAPRERGALVDLDGTAIHADTVPDLFKQVLDYLFNHGLWDKVVALAPYGTSAQRYLFSKTPKHPNGNDFFVEVKYRDLYFEAHKNYPTSITQLTRFLEKCGVSMTYRGK